MGLAPIFLLAFVPGVGRLSFHLAFWPGLSFGIMRVVENALSTQIFPSWLSIGDGKYAADLGVNVYGLVFCMLADPLGAWLSRRSSTLNKQHDFS